MTPYITGFGVYIPFPSVIRKFRINNHVRIDILANDDIDFSGSYLEVVNKKENPYIRTKANSNTDDNLDSIIEELQYRKDSG